MRTFIQWPRRAVPTRAGRRLPAVWLVALGLVACATSAPPPTSELAAATAGVAHAAGAGGQEFAPQEMQLARDKLLRAQAAMTAQDYPLALAMSQQADVDAQLAEAKAESLKARRSADAARDGNRILREEIQRKTP